MGSESLGINEHLSRGMNLVGNPNVRARTSEMNAHQEQPVTQMGFSDILDNNNNVTPQQVGRWLRDIGDELFNSAYQPNVRSSQTG